jgi:hypothetical protein
MTSTSGHASAAALGMPVALPKKADIAITATPKTRPITLTLTPDMPLRE